MDNLLFRIVRTSVDVRTAGPVTISLGRVFVPLAGLVHCVRNLVPKAPMALPVATNVSVKMGATVTLEQGSAAALQAGQ